MVQFGAPAVLLAAAALLQSGYAQVSTVTVYRNSACSAVYTTSSTTSTSSSIQPSTSAISDNAANGGNPFIIQVQPPPGSFTRKRQAQSRPIYITGSGQTTIELAQAQRYVISDGRLLGATGGQVSTSLDALNAPLAISTTIQNITVSFTARNGNVRWANPAFDNGTVSFYASAAGQVISRFNGPVDPTWSPLVLEIQPLSGPPASTSSSSLSTPTASSSSTTSTSSVSTSGGGSTPGTRFTLSSSSTSTSSRASFGYDPSTSSSASYSYAPNNSSPPGSSYSTSTRSSSLSSINTSTLPTTSTPGQPTGPVNPTISSSTTSVESSSTAPTTSSSSVLIPTPAPVPTSPSAPYTRLTSPTACDFGDPPNIDQDDNYCIVTLPFNITFYNTQSSSTTYPNTNGLLCLNSGSQAYLPSTLPVKIFNAQPFPESCIFPFWEDLFLAGTSDPKQGVYYQLNEDETAVTYEWLAGRGGFADSYNFQLFYDSATPGVFTMRYGDVGGGDNGSSALVGVQGVDASGKGVSATYGWGEGNITPDLTVVCDTNTNTCTSS